MLVSERGCCTDGCHLICGAERCCYLGEVTHAVFDKRVNYDWGGRAAMACPRQEQRMRR